MFTYTPQKPQKNKPITLGLMGQSNMLYHVANHVTGGDMTKDDRVLIFRKDLNPPSFEVADIALPPFNGNNNLGFHFAKKYAETFDTTVKIIMNAQAGESILRWSEDDGNDYMWTDLVTQIADSGTTKLDIVLWNQGQALPERNEPITFYATEMQKMFDRLNSQTFFDKNTPFIAGELTPTYPTVNNFYRNYQFDGLFTEPNFAVAKIGELTGDPNDPIPYLHHTGEEMVVLGREKYWNAYLSFYTGYIAILQSIFQRVGSTGISIGKNAKNVLEPEFDPDVYINSDGIVPFFIEKEGGALYHILQGFRDSAFCPVRETRVARGTKESPSAIIDTQRMQDLSSLGHDGTSMKQGARIIFRASENWSATNRGCMLEFHAIENGSTVSEPKAFLHGSGTLDLPFLQTYADNASALTGGLTAGMFYKTATGDLKIVY